MLIESDNESIPHIYFWRTIFELFLNYVQSACLHIGTALLVKNYSKFFYQFIFFFLEFFSRKLLNSESHFSVCCVYSVEQGSLFQCMFTYSRRWDIVKCL